MRSTSGLASFPLPLGKLFREGSTKRGSFLGSLEIHSTDKSFLPLSSALENKRHRLGVTELAAHNLLTPYPIQYTRGSAKVAQFKMTVLIAANGTTRITPGLAQPYVHSAYTIPDDSNIARLMATEAVKTVKSGKALAGIGAGEVVAPAAGMDVDM